MTNFESFSRRMLPLKNDPHVTLQKRGTIALNRSALEALGSPVAVELLFDRERQVIGLRAIDQKAENAYVIRHPASSSTGPWVVSAMAFTHFYDIDTAESRRWLAYLDGGVLCIDLSRPGEPVSGSRARRAP